jgi:hypothetical protein
MNLKRLTLAATAAFVALSLAACGDSVVSSDELSAQVKSSLEESVGAPLETVDCPEVKAEVGETFSCDATEPNGNEIGIEGEITQVDSETDQVNFNVEVVSS